MDCLALKKLVYFRDMFYRLCSFQIIMCLTESARFKAMPGAVLIGGWIKQDITQRHFFVNVKAVSKEPIEFTMNFNTDLEKNLKFSKTLQYVLICLCMCEHFCTCRGQTEGSSPLARRK